MLQGIAVGMLQCWESTFLYDAFMPRKGNRRSFVLRLLISGFLFGLSYNLLFSDNLLFSERSLLSVIFSLLFFLVVNALLYEDRFYNRLLAVMGWYALLISVDGTIAPLVRSFHAVLRPDTDNVPAAWLVYLITGSEFIVIFLLISLLSYISQALHKAVADHRRDIFTSGLYVVAIVVFLFFTFAVSMAYGIPIPLPLISSCVAFIVIGSILFQKKEQHMIQLQKESLALNEKLTAEAESIEILSEAYTKQRRLTHEYNSHLMTLQALLQQKEFDQMERYLSELMSTQTERILHVNTHHAVLDAIFNQKAIIAQKNNIDLQFQFNDLQAVAVSSCDLAVLIGNLMDNAIEASLKLPVQKRLIEVRAVLDGNFIFSVRNRTLPVAIINDHIKTTKPQPELHGFGLANVDSILSRYPDSFHSMEYRDGWFYYTFEMPNALRAPE